MRVVPRSLTGRLVAGSLVLVLVAVGVTGVAMDFVLRRFIQGQIDGRLDGQILAVAAAARPAPDGTFALQHLVDGPPFDRPMSGWYWEVLAPKPVLGSTSLQRAAFTIDGPPVGFMPKPETRTGRGPSGTALRVRIQRLHLADMTVTIAASAPLEALAGPRREALTPLAAMLAALAAVLAGGVVLQVRLGLRPLVALRDDLARVRAGERDAIEAAQPAELLPVVSELNRLLEQNAANLVRARRHVANLAHGLKTPLATLALHLGERPGDETMARLVALMDRRIRHHLARARAAAVTGPARARTALAARVEDHALVSRRLNADKALVVEVDMDPRLAVACETQDVDEMLGNVLENACRWARTRIVVSAVDAAPWIDLAVEDDGPGLQADEAQEMLKPGRRLDEAAPGYGFGLPITRELVELYGGTLALERAGLGGLAVRLRLPRAGAA